MSARRAFDWELFASTAAPPLALGLVWAVIGTLPPVDCYGEAVDSTLPKIGLVVLAGLVSLLCVGVAIMRLRQLAPEPPASTGQVAIIATVLGAIALFVLALEPAALVSLILFSALVGSCLTGVTLLVLVGMWGSRRDIDDVGLLLPFYLLGAGLFVFPGSAMLGLILNSGALC